MLAGGLGGERLALAVRGGRAALKGSGHDLLDELAYQVALLGKESIDGADGLRILGLAVEGAGDAPRALQDLPRLAPCRLGPLRLA